MSTRLIRGQRGAGSEVAVEFLPGCFKLLGPGKTTHIVIMSDPIEFALGIFGQQAALELASDPRVVSLAKIVLAGGKT